MPDAAPKIVSGGQTGADRAALDAALEVGVRCGGWCPAGRKAEDGTIPSRYPVTELPGAGYAARTRRNVVDSDATLIVSFGPPDGGTALTVTCCRQERKPFLVIDGNAMNAKEAAGLAADFITKHHVQTLNVAGPRVSKQPAIYDYVRQLVLKLLGKGTV